jgi:hypothetical protein
VADLEDACLEVLDCFYKVGTWSSFCETGRYAIVYVVGEHEFPASGVALFSYVGFAVDNFWDPRLERRWWGREDRI